MIRNVFARIAKFGQEMTVTDDTGESVTCQGFLQPEDTMQETFPENYTAPGMLAQARYLLLMAPEAVAEGRTAKTLRLGQRTFEILGLQPIYCGSYLTHWEGVAREREM